MIQNEGIVLVDSRTGKLIRQAQRLFTSAQQQFLNLIRGTPSLLPTPVESMDRVWLPHERAHVERMTRCSAVGSPERVKR